MDENGDCGAVAFLEHIRNPISVARLVMEKTPHVMLVGDSPIIGAYCIQPGFNYAVYDRAAGNRLIDAASRL